MPFESRAEPQKGDKILIVGGYGQVGRSIAGRLAPLFPSRVIVAGRNRTKADLVAAEVSHGAKGLALDIEDRAAASTLSGVAVAVVCLDQKDTRFVDQCLSQGIHYVDISADYRFLSQVEHLHDLARQHRASAILSGGVAPSLTNLLAARAKEQMEKVDRIDILLEFGLADEHGRAAVEWMFDNLDRPYEVQENGHPRLVRTFGESIDIGLPGQGTARSAYRFNFSDQHVVGRTVGVPTVSTWVRFEDRFSTWLFAMSARQGLGRLLRRPFWRRIAVWLFMNTSIGSDTCGVAVRATGRRRNGRKTLTLGLVGRKEALMTAVVAAETVRQLLSFELEPGVFHSEQVIALAPVVAALRQDLTGIIMEL